MDVIWSCKDCSRSRYGCLREVVSMSFMNSVTNNSTIQYNSNIWDMCIIWRPYQDHHDTNDNSSILQNHQARLDSSNLSKSCYLQGYLPYKSSPAAWVHQITHTPHTPPQLHPSQATDRCVSRASKAANGWRGHALLDFDGLFLQISKFRVDHISTPTFIVLTTTASSTLLLNFWFSCIDRVPITISRQHHPQQTNLHWPIRVNPRIIQFPPNINQKQRHPLSIPPMRPRERCHSKRLKSTL